MPEITQTYAAPNREEWRKWLEANHAIASEIWLVYYKKHTGVPSITYAEAVEEALCFGWIDSVQKRLDDEKSAQRFTPRKNAANWSDLNKRRVAKLFRQGKMTPAGMAKLNFDPTEVSEEEPPTPPEPEIPDYFLQALSANLQAETNFQNMPPSQKRYYMNWITDAKKPETRQKRITQALSMLEQNKKLGI